MVLPLLFLSMSCANQDRAYTMAEEYIQSMYPSAQVSGIEVMGVDSDGDGYCSVSARIVHEDGEDEILPLQCSCGWIQVWHSGCRVPALHSGRRSE